MMHRPASASSGATALRLLAAGAFVVFALGAAGLKPWLAASDPDTPQAFTPQAGARVVADFTAHAGGGREAHRTIFSTSAAFRAYFWGTWIDGDGFTGTVRSEPFPLDAGWLQVPVTGYPAAPGNELALEVLGEGQTVVEEIVCRATSPREALGWWEIDVQAWQGRTARLRLTDGLAGPGGWLGVGAPIASEAPGNIDPARRPGGTNYARALAAGALVLGLLWLPGAWWRVFGPARLGGGLVPVAAGLGVLVGLGLAQWIVPPLRSEGVTRAVFAAAAIGSAMLMWRPVRGGPATACAKVRGDAAGVWLVTLGMAVFAGLNPWPVVQEFGAGTSLPGRMVASPPDAMIPYQSAVYLWHGKDGKSSRAAYFGDWSIGSRGPVVPLAGAAVLRLAGVRPADPPAQERLPWPVTTDGAILLRWLGWATNAAVILAAARLLEAAGATTGGRRLGLAWLALAPVTMINVVFLWPKLLATAGLLFAAAEVIERRPVRAGLWAAAAWLSHPVAALMLPPLALLAGHHAWACARGSGAQPAAARNRAARLTPAFRVMAVLTLTVLACALPWLLYKRWLGHRELFFDYLLGDGHDRQPATSVAAWLGARWQNLWLTVAPGAFLVSAHMRVWLEGALWPLARVAVHYAKTLPGHLGLAGFAAAVAGSARSQGNPAAGRLKLHFAALAGLLMLVAWGYSADGLGRNCLEPLSIALLVATAAGWRDVRPAWAAILLIATWLEGRLLEWSSFAGATGFPDQLTAPAGLTCLAGTTLLSTGLLAWAWPRREPGP